MSSTAVSSLHHVALMGFSGFEQVALDACLELARSRSPAYAPCATIEDAQFVVANADRGGVLDLLTAAQRMGDTVLVGAAGSSSVAARLDRPIDPTELFRLLDEAVQRRSLAASAARTAPHRVTMAELAADWPEETQPQRATLQPSLAERATGLFAGVRLPSDGASGHGRAKARTALGRIARAADIRAADLRARGLLPPMAPDVVDVEPVPYAPRQDLGPWPTEPSFDGRAEAPVDMPLPTPVPAPAPVVLRGLEPSPEPAPVVVPRLEPAPVLAPVVLPGSEPSPEPAPVVVPESVPESESVPTAIVPAASVPSAVPSVAPVVAPAASPSAHSKTLAVLVVNAGDGSDLESVLASQNVKATCVDRLHHAFAMLDAYPFELIAVDVGFAPRDELDGLQICHALRRRAREPGDVCPPILVLSAQPSPLEEARAALAGCSAYVSRPPRAHALAKALADAGLRPEPPPLPGDEEPRG